jgi:hypothetical protein
MPALAGPTDWQTCRWVEARWPDFAFIRWQSVGTFTVEGGSRVATTCSESEGKFPGPRVPILCLSFDGRAKDTSYSVFGGPRGEAAEVVLFDDMAWYKKCEGKTPPVATTN